MTDFDADLDDWILISWPGALRAWVVVGTVRNDRKRRFRSGTQIHTSKILTPLDQIEEGAIVQTLNTRYRLGAQRLRN